MTTKDEIKPWLIDNDHYSAIGRVAASWAALDAMVSSAIWQIGEIPDEIGACITSQIFTFDGKMKALISILERRQNFDKTIKELNKFHVKIRKILEFRNRVLHDAWIYDINTNKPHRLQITADKKPVLEYIPAPTEELIANANKTSDFVDEFNSIILPAIERFPPLPKK